jgi:hypothetical protein
VLLLVMVPPPLGQAWAQTAASPAAQPGLSALEMLLVAHQLEALALAPAATPRPKPEPASRRPTGRYSSRKRDISLGYGFLFFRFFNF